MSDETVQPSSSPGAPPATTPAAEDKVEVPDGVSAFAAKVLNQLSLSAWLPAAFFAASVTFLVQIRRLGHWSFSDAIRNITDDWKSVLILGLPILILATLLTQAFSFGAIRALEGYWSRRGPATWARTFMIKRQAKFREKLDERRRSAVIDAFCSARDRYLNLYPTPVVDALERQAFNADAEDIDLKHAKILARAKWQDKCDPWKVSRVAHLDDRIAEFPSRPSRTLPMRLGNLIRATEDSLTNAGDDVQGFVMRRKDAVNQRIRVQHDQFRDRLDMYCTLVFVSLALAVVSFGLLWTKVAWPGVAISSAAFVGFALVCYQSAVASARGYCTILKVMDAARPAS